MDISNSTAESLRQMKKALSYENYVWKSGKDADGNYTEIKMMDADEATLHKWYNHCVSMLTATGEHPGRQELIKRLVETSHCCRAEQYKRQMSNPFNFYSELNTLLEKPEYLEAFPPTEYANIPIGKAIQIDSEYETVPIREIKRACLHFLGRFPKKLITFDNILALGISPTSAERKEYFDTDKKIIPQIQEMLNIKPSVPLKLVKSGGLTYLEFRAMYQLKDVPYESLTGTQLNTLINKVIPASIAKLEQQADRWEKLKYQIKKVCAEKGYEVPNNNIV